MATFYHALGFAPDAPGVEIHDRQMLHYRLTDGRPVEAPFG
jgi:hypothetical protein